MLYNYWGGKTLYYSLVNKVGAKERLKEDNVIAFTPPPEEDGEDDCLSCKL
jgi:hypothetical protein